MDAAFADFATAQNSEDGYLLATSLTPEPPATDPERLYAFRQDSNVYSVQTDLQYKIKYNPAIKLHKSEIAAWIDTFTAFYNFLGALLPAQEAQSAGGRPDWSRVYDGWKDVVNALYKGYQSNAFAAWTIPCLYVAGKYLRIFAINADNSAASQRDSGLAFGALQEEDAFGGGSKNEKLEDAARQINRLFGLCISDRAPLEDSRKWALYYIASLMFKTYFRLNSISLSKGPIRSLRATAGDMPLLSQFPKAHQVTFKYYVGVIHFLEEDYAQAEEYLDSAYAECHKGAAGNTQLILTYLIPTKIMTKLQLPTREMLAPYPRLERLFAPVCQAIKSANLAALDEALTAGEAEFVKRRIYLTLERSRDVAIRNLFRKTFIAGGFEPPKEDEAAAAPVRKTRVPVMELAAALQMAGAEVGDGNGGIDCDEVECIIANMIYKNYMKGYIARERGIVVLSKAGAFPGTGV